MSIKDPDVQPRNDSDSEDLNSLICNEKCNTLLQIFESKFVNIVRAFIQLSKEFHSEQNKMKSALNSAIDTINILVDEVESNKQTIENQQKELQNVKNEINKIKYGPSAVIDSEEKTHHIQERGFPLLDNSSESFSHMLINDVVQENSNEIKQLRDDITKLEKLTKASKNATADYQYLQNQIQKLQDSSSVIQTQQNNTNQLFDRLQNDFKLTFSDVKQQLDELNNQQNELKSKRKKFKIGKKKDDSPFPLVENETVESRYFDSYTDNDENQTVMDKLDSYSRDIKNMQEEIQTLKVNIENPPHSEVPSEYDPGEIARIQKKIVKLKERIVKLEKNQKNNFIQAEDEAS